MNRRTDKVGIIISIIFLLIMTVIAVKADKASENVKTITYEEKIEKIPIASLGDKNGIKGGFSGNLFVQSGYMNSEKYYEVMLVDKNYSDEEILYQYLPLRAVDTKTFEFKDELKKEAYIKIKWKIKKVDGKEVLYDSFGIAPPHPNLEQILLFTDTKGFIQKISIHAPKGTINKDFSIDFSKER